MNLPEQPDSVPTPTQFAEGNSAEGHDLRCRILAGLKARDLKLKNVHVTVFGGTVALRGEVRSLHDKRLYLDSCRHVSGVIRVVDELLVTKRT